MYLLYYLADGTRLEAGYYVRYNTAWGADFAQPRGAVLPENARQRRDDAVGKPSLFLFLIGLFSHERYHAGIRSVAAFTAASVLFSP